MRNETAETARDALLGLRPFLVFGHRVVIRSWSGPRLARPLFLPFAGVRMAIVRNTWGIWKDYYEAIAKVTVHDWDGMTYDELWLNPEIGLSFCRAIARARR